MHSLVAILVPVIIVVCVGIIVLAVADRFSPDPLIAKVIKVVTCAVILIVLITKLLPLLA